VPELPDITIYLGALAERILGKRLRTVRIGSPFVLADGRAAIERITAMSTVP